MSSLTAAPTRQFVKVIDLDNGITDVATNSDGTITLAEVMNAIGADLGSKGLAVNGRFLTAPSDLIEAGAQPVVTPRAAHG